MKILFSYIISLDVIKTNTLTLYYIFIELYSLLKCVDDKKPAYLSNFYEMWNVSNSECLSSKHFPNFERLKFTNSY